MHVRGYLERFLFTSEQMNTPVGKLSGGEQSRLLLAALMLQEAQILVLDEPTNDLDLPTLAVLEEALTGFDGAVLLVTHDRYFLDQVATTILAFDPSPSSTSGANSIVPFASLAQWEGWRAERLVAARAAAKATSAASATAPGAGRRSKLGYQEQREYDAIEETLARAETAVNEAVAESERPEHAADAARLIELLALVDERRAEVDRLYARWARARGQTHPDLRYNPPHGDDHDSERTPVRRHPARHRRRGDRRDVRDALHRLALDGRRQGRQVRQLARSRQPVLVRARPRPGHQGLGRRASPE